MPVGVLALGRRQPGWRARDRAWPGGLPMTEDQEPDPQRPKDDIRWLIYLAIGFVVVLALLLLSGLQSSHSGH
jgi:hypothetical protein